MAIQWKDPEIKDRLLAAIIAAAGTVRFHTSMSVKHAEHALTDLDQYE